MDLPVEGSKERGIIRRLEPYGAFVEMERFPRLRGLVHISEMAEYRIEKPEDVVSCDDIVWVRVLSAKSEEADGRVRHRIQLSMKDVDNELSRPARSQAAQQLETNLSSTIGMAFAKDPMSHLIMKHENKGTIIKGYALVDETEGEPDRQQAEDAPWPMGRGRGTTLPAWMTTGDGSEPQGLSNKAPRPIGRGRGATLPAWMTRGDGPGGEEKSRLDESRHRHEQHHRKEKKKYSRKRDGDRDDGRHGKKHRKRDDGESRRRSPSVSNRDASRESRHSHKHPRREDHVSRRRSPSGSDREEPRGGLHSKKHHPRKDREYRQRSDSSHSDRPDRRRRGKNRTSRRHSPYRDRDHSDGHDSRLKFSSVEEAKELIAELERKSCRSQRTSKGSDRKRSSARSGDDVDESKRSK